MVALKYRGVVLISRRGKQFQKQREGWRDGGVLCGEVKSNAAPGRTKNDEGA